MTLRVALNQGGKALQYTAFLFLGGRLGEEGESEVE